MGSSREHTKLEAETTLHKIMLSKKTGGYRHRLAFYYKMSI